MQVGPKTYVFGVPKFETKAGVILGTKQVLVVDTLHHPSEAKVLKDAAESQGREVGWVFYTHWHGDHTFGGQALDGLFVSSDKCAEQVQKRFSREQLGRLAAQDPRYPADFEVRIPSITFSDAMTIDIGGACVRLERWAGHTPCSAIAVLEQDGVVFAGDELFVQCHPWAGEAALARWCSNLKRLMDVGSDLGTVVPGHGPVLTGRDIRREIGAFLSYLEGTLATASGLAAKGIAIEEAMAYPGFPQIGCEMTDNEIRMRQSSIERACHEIWELQSVRGL